MGVDGDVMGVVVALLGFAGVAAWVSWNWMAGGRLRRHCSSWWWSSALIAGSGKVPESAGVVVVLLALILDLDGVVCGLQ